MGTRSEMGERMPELPSSFLNFKQMYSCSVEEMVGRKDVVLSELTQTGEIKIRIKPSAHQVSQTRSNMGFKELLGEIHSLCTFSDIAFLHVSS